MREIYKPIEGYEGYEVSNLGNVKSLKGIKERILKPSSNGLGYLCVVLHKNGKPKMFTVHKLVAITFLNHKPNGHKTVIDHINGIKQDNRLENLREISQRENSSKLNKGSSKYVGVCWCKRANKWLSSININGKSKHLGYFKNEKLASAVYQYELNNLNKN